MKIFINALLDVESKYVTKRLSKQYNQISSQETSQQTYFYNKYNFST